MLTKDQERRFTNSPFSRLRGKTTAPVVIVNNAPMYEGVVKWKKSFTGRS